MLLLWFNIVEYISFEYKYHDVTIFIYDFLFLLDKPLECIVALTLVMKTRIISIPCMSLGENYFEIYNFFRTGFVDVTLEIALLGLQLLNVNKWGIC